MRVRNILVAMALSVTVLPALPALGQTTDPTFTVTGSGWGHMVGLSQYGARAMAVAGNTASQITGFYYANTTVQTLQSVVPADNFIISDLDPLWIGLLQNRTSFSFRVATS